MKKIGELKGIPIVISELNKLKQNEYLLKVEEDGFINLYTRDSNNKIVRLRGFKEERYIYYCMTSGADPDFENYGYIKIDLEGNIFEYTSNQIESVQKLPTSLGIALGNDVMGARSGFTKGIFKIVNGNCKYTNDKDIENPSIAKSENIYEFYTFGTETSYSRNIYLTILNGDKKILIGYTGNLQNLPQ